MVTQKDDGRIFNVATKREATVDDLYRFDGDGKAELVNGELVPMPLTGHAHGHAVMEIAASLHQYGRRTKRGRAFGDVSTVANRSMEPSTPSTAKTGAPSMNFAPNGGPV